MNALLALVHHEHCHEQDVLWESDGPRRLAIQEADRKVWCISRMSPVFIVVCHWGSVVVPYAAIANSAMLCIMVKLIAVN